MSTRIIVFDLEKAAYHFVTPAQARIHGRSLLLEPEAICCYGFRLAFILSKVEGPQ